MRPVAALRAALAGAVLLGAALPAVAADPAGLAEPLLGIDAAGRDRLEALLRATLVSLGIAAAAAAAQTAIGLPLGRMAARGPGRAATLALAAAEAQHAFSPLLIGLLALAALAAPGAGAALPAPAMAALIALVLGLAGWPGAALAVHDARRPARIATPPIADAPLPPRRRGRTATLRAMAAAQAGRALSAEAALSFLGIGMPPALPSLGTLLRDWLAAGPAEPWWAGALVASVLAALALALMLMAGRAAPAERGA